jgi:citrate synthase
MSEPRIFEGLEGVLVARTELSEVDGACGRLTVRGHPIEALAGGLPFEAMLGLLLDGKLPDAVRLAELVAELGTARARAHAALAPRFAALCSNDAMTTLLSGLATLPNDATSSDALATAAVTTAHWIQTQRGEPLLSPRPELTHALDLLAMANLPAASEAQGKLLDAYLVTVAEHGFNASTFAARVTASTGAALPAAMLAGVATLSGPLHGGAPGPVLDMLDAVGEPERALRYVRAELLAGRRIMGMGHRIYRVRDPRAFVLERALEAFRSHDRSSPRLELARAVETAAEAELSRKYPERAIRANVEFYTALLLEALAIPRPAFTAIFACARLAGYAAHYAEQRRTGRLIRPSALYVGPHSGHP